MYKEYLSSFREVYLSQKYKIYLIFNYLIFNLVVFGSTKKYLCKFYLCFWGAPIKNISLKKNMLRQYRLLQTLAENPY